MSELLKIRVKFSPNKCFQGAYPPGTTVPRNAPPPQWSAAGFPQPGYQMQGPPGGMMPGGVHKPQPGYAPPIAHPGQRTAMPVMFNPGPASTASSTHGGVPKSGQLVPYQSGATGSTYESSVAQQNAQHHQRPVPELQNIVSTANLSTKLDLRKIALNCRNAEYNPKRFAAVIIRIRDPKTTALIFSSGKMVITGAKSEEKSQTAAKMYAKMIKKVGNPSVKLQEFKIQNIVGSCDVKFCISLESLNTEHQTFSTYEPELFPGLIYRMHTPKIVLLIFASGKIVLTGAKTREDIEKAFEQIYSVLKRFQKKPPKVAAAG